MTNSLTLKELKLNTHIYEDNSKKSAHLHMLMFPPKENSNNPNTYIFFIKGIIKNTKF